MGAALGGEELFEVGEGDVVLAELDERAGETTHHAPDEVRGGDAEEQSIGEDFEGSVVDFDQTGLVGAGGVLRLEATEVVAASQQGGGLLHEGEVKRLFDPPDVLLFEGEFACGDLVGILAGDGVVARVEGYGGCLQSENGDFGGQLLIGLSQQEFRVNGLPGEELDVSNLPARMDAGIGAASAHELNAGVGGGFQSGAEFAHDGAGVLLFSPTGILAAVIFEREAEAVIGLRASGSGWA